MTTTSKPLKFDLPIGTQFLDTAGDVWEVTADGYRKGRCVYYDCFLAKQICSDRYGTRGYLLGCISWTKATGKRFGCREKIASTDPTAIAQHIEQVEAKRIAVEAAEQAERDEKDRKQAEHDATPLHQLANRIANCKGVSWDWCNGWEVLGMELLEQIEIKLKAEGKLCKS